MNTTKKHGFTLIELLVVIAIIGILAGLLFPTITSALQRAQATSLTSNGKNIVQAIVSANIERESYNEAPIWPDKTTKLSGVSASGEQKDCGPYSTGYSNDYFGDMVEFRLVDDLDYSIFAGAGIRSAGHDRQLFDDNNGGYNAWSIVSGLNDNVSGDTPFMWSCNLSIEDSDLTSASPSSAGAETPKNNWSEKLSVTAKPFGKGRIVVVTKGQSAFQVPGKAMYDSSKFMRGGNFTDLDIVVLPAK